MSTNDEGKIRNNCRVYRYITSDALILYILTCTFTVSFHQNPVSCMWLVGFCTKNVFILHNQDGKSLQNTCCLLYKEIQERILAKRVNPPYSSYSQDDLSPSVLTDYVTTFDYLVI